MGFCCRFTACATARLLIELQVFLWCLYFDHSPSGHYGTIRQQIWSTLHFPLHLAIVGVVEGSQQVVYARYSLVQFIKLQNSLIQYCLVDQLDGPSLMKALKKVSDYYQFNEKSETMSAVDKVNHALQIIGNTTNLCTPQNMESHTEWPDELWNWLFETLLGIYESIGMKLPKIENVSAAASIRTWKVVYMYYWSCFVVVMLCSSLFLLLIRKHRADVFDYVSLMIRGVAVVGGIVLIGVGFSADTLYAYMGSAAVLPTIVGMLFLVLVFDKGSAVFANWRLKRSGAPYAIEGAKEHGTPHALQPNPLPTQLDGQQKVGVHIAMQPLLPGQGY